MSGRERRPCCAARLQRRRAQAQAGAVGRRVLVQRGALARRAPGRADERLHALRRQLLPEARACGRVPRGVSFSRSLVFESAHGGGAAGPL
jgi:hypothetical protein